MKGQSKMKIRIKYKKGSGIMKKVMNCKPRGHICNTRN